ncbi:MAG TPA: hypothetical protein VHG10_11790 [Glycomyces sp.]|nr:hypothetical protein [Glycomyces sp.]
MDWTATYLLVAVACLAVVELWFIAVMIVTSRRYRALSGEDKETGPPPDPSSVSFEDLGMLAGGLRRWAEVALFRLYQEGHVEEDGLIALIAGSDEIRAEDRPHSARGAIVARLRDREPAHVMAVIEAAWQETDSAGLIRRASA